MRVRFPFPKLVPASGGGLSIKNAEKSIRFVKYGCANRPFFHIAVIMKRRHQYDMPIEQLGSYDPLPNEKNEKLCSINIERILYWYGEGATFTKPVAELLGLSGLMPIHPLSYMKAWHNRRKGAALAANPNKEEGKSAESSL